MSKLFYTQNIKSANTLHHGSIHLSVRDQIQNNKDSSTKIPSYVHAYANKLIGLYVTYKKQKKNGNKNNDTSLG